MQCTLQHDHKPLETFLSRGMKIAKLDRWAMLLQEYDIRFIHIKDKDNILADTISRLHTVDIYEDPAEVRSQCPPVSKSQLESRKVTDKLQLLDTRTAQQLLNITSKTLRRLQKQDRFCKKKVHKLKTGIHNEFYLNSKNILKKKTVVNNMEVNNIVIPTPLTYTLLHNCIGHQGCARTFNMLKHKFWWKGMRLDVRNYIYNCITCSKNLPNTACHPQLHLEIPKVPFACITIDTIGKLPTTSSGNRYALTCIDLLTSYIIAVPVPNKAAESVLEAYLSVISDHRVLEIVNDCTLVVESPDGKTILFNINDTKPISARAATDNALQDFKLSAMKKEHTH